MLPALDSGGVERGTVEVARHLVEQGHRSIVISGDGRLREQLVAAGTEHLCWEVGAKRPGTLLWIPRVRALLKERRPDILHLRSRLPAWIGYWAWRGLDPAVRPALVTTVHGFYTVGHYSAIMTRGERVIAISESIRSYILKNYPRVDPNRITVIPRGVDPQQYPHGYRPPAPWLEQWRRDHPRTRDRYVITLPARLTRWKGQEDFIAIIATLKQRGMPVHGLLAGGAHPRKSGYEIDLRRRVSAAGLADDITFLGERADMREVMAVSDVVLSLSNEPEAFGRTTIEALSLGRPTAGYDHGGVGEQLAAVLPEGRIPVGDRQAAANLLMRWRDTPPAVPAEHPFTLARMLTSTLSLYLTAAQARTTDRERSRHE
jgi:glycosyltransferase involved in cell wall biosynthesis